MAFGRIDGRRRALKLYGAIYEYAFILFEHNYYEKVAMRYGSTSSKCVSMWVEKKKN